MLHWRLLHYIDIRVRALGYAEVKLFMQLPGRRICDTSKQMKSSHSNPPLPIPPPLTRTLHQSLIILREALSGVTRLRGQ